MSYTPTPEERDLIERRGYVIETPTAKLWGFACPLAYALRPPVVPLAFDSTDPAIDTWFAWYAEGTASEIAALCPHPLAFLAFARRGKVRAYAFADIVPRLKDV